MRGWAPCVSSTNAVNASHRGLSIKAAISSIDGSPSGEQLVPGNHGHPPISQGAARGSISTDFKLMIGNLRTYVPNLSRQLGKLASHRFAPRPRSARCPQLLPLQRFRQPPRPPAEREPPRMTPRLPLAPAQAGRREPWYMIYFLIVMRINQAATRAAPHERKAHGHLRHHRRIERHRREDGRDPARTRPRGGQHRPQGRRHQREPRHERGPRGRHRRAAQALSRRHRRHDLQRGRVGRQGAHLAHHLAQLLRRHRDGQRRARPLGEEGRQLRRHIVELHRAGRGRAWTWPAC